MQQLATRDMGSSCDNTPLRARRKKHLLSRMNYAKIIDVVKSVSTKAVVVLMAMMVTNILLRGIQSKP